jgi:adenylate cyclase
LLQAGANGLQQRGYSLLVLFFVAVTTAVFIANPGVLTSMRSIVFDTYQRLSPAPPVAGDPVRIVAIDEESLARLGQWPWPRPVLARLTDNLGAQGARAVVFDVLFAEPDRTSPEQMLAWMAPERSARIRNVIAGWPTHDGEFAAAIARNSVVLAVAMQSEPTTEMFPFKAGMATRGPDPSPSLSRYSGFSDNLPELTDAAQGLGFINWIPDRDQVIRRVPLLAVHDSTVVPSLALEALRVSEQQSTYVVQTFGGERPGVLGVRLGDRLFPTDPQSAVFIHFRHSDRASYIPAWRVVEGEFDSSDIAGKIILVGATAPGLMDLRATPLDASVPGVEVHEQVIEQMLAGRFLTRPEIAPAIELLVALGSILLIALAAPRLSAGLGALVGGGVVIALFAISMWAFKAGGYLFDPIFPAAAAFLFATASSVFLYQRTERQRAQIRRAFNQYVAPDVVKQLVAHPDRLALGGEVRDLTLLFCDVRNFTGISEGMSAEQLTSFINSLLTPLTDIIIEQGGTVDKYMGDAIMAFWNAPLDDPNHAQRASRAAAMIAARMHDLNAQWRSEAQALGAPFKDVAIGIGLNSGECCVGNLGSHQRYDYSAIGDNVNITSRLESLTKFYGLTLVASEETVRRVPDLEFVEIDLVRLKGRTAPTRVFTLAAHVLSGDAAEARVAHDGFVAAYRAGRWEEARSTFISLRQRNLTPLTGLYEIYARRLATLSASQPADWDGVYDLEEK